MSLKGSLQTVALPEVLHFLANTGKSGELQVTGVQGEGRLWFDSGRITAFSAGCAAEPFEAVYELLRIDDGDFDFDADRPIPDDAVRGSGDEGVEAVIEAGQARLAEWRGIGAVVPSLRHQLSLVAESPAEGVMLEPAQWALIVAIGDGRSVKEVLDRGGLREFEGCRAVRDVVEAGLVTVGEPLADTDTLAEAAEPGDQTLAEAGEVEQVAEAELEAEAGPAVEPDVALSDEGMIALDEDGPVSAEPSAAKVVAEAVPVAVDGAEDEAGADQAEAAAAAWSWNGSSPAWPADPPESAVAEDGMSLTGSMLRFGIPASDGAADGPDGAADGFDGADDGGFADQDSETASEAPDPGVARLVAWGAVDEPGPDSADDRYAALKAAVMEVHELGDDLDPDTEEPATDAGAVYELGGDGEIDGRAALQALLNEVTAPPAEAGEWSEPAEMGEWSEPAQEGDAGWEPVAAAADDEPVDGLADRGPWTEDELAVMDSESWSEPAGGPSNVVPFVGSTSSEGTVDADESAEEDAPVGEEPINRGLLLKFLSSVRN